MYTLYKIIYIFDIPSSTCCKVEQTFLFFCIFVEKKIECRCSAFTNSTPPIRCGRLFPTNGVELQHVTLTLFDLHVSFWSSFALAKSIWTLLPKIWEPSDFTAFTALEIGIT